jgi:tetratricopeptide (TPR) repeat protein
MWKQAFDKAIEINPQNSLAWYNKGITLRHLNKYEEAIKAYEKAIESNPLLGWNINSIKHLKYTH